MEKSYNSIVIIGDPIIDIYIDSKTKKYDQRMGGALNTFMNAKHIKGMGTYFFPSQQELLSLKINPLLNENLNSKTIYNSIYYSILRIDNFKDTPLSDPKFKSNFYTWSFNQRKYDLIKHSIDVESSALVLSDYNKGTLNKPVVLNNISNKFKFCVVDTRYRSINLEYLKLSKINMWRCTGEEYDKAFAKNFDYTIWTNANSPVKILNSSQECLATLDFDFIDETKVKDTCGAGDTFTASFAAYLNSLKTKPSIEHIIDACYFSLECCQEVVQSHKTSITTKKLYLIDT